MLLWKGIDFKDKGIIVEKTPTFSKGKKRIETYEIEGRDGFLSIDSETYSSFVVSVECHCNTDYADLDSIKEYLDGYGTLSPDGKRQYTAIIQNSIEFSKVIYNFRSFVVQFLCNPIAEDINENEFDVLNNEENLIIADATYKMLPTIEIEGSGDLQITINNQTFYLYNADGLYVLDCKNKVITKNMINQSHIMLNDFPTLKPGENIIEYIGNITSFLIKYRKCYL